MATVTKNPTYPTSPTRTGSACSTTPPSSLRLLRRARTPRLGAARGGRSCTRRLPRATAMSSALSSTRSTRSSLVVRAQSPERTAAALQQACDFVVHVSWKLVAWMPLVGWFFQSDKIHDRHKARTCASDSSLHLGDQAPHPRSSHLFPACLSKLFSSHTTTRGGYQKLFIIINESIILKAVRKPANFEKTCEFYLRAQTWRVLIGSLCHTPRML